MSLTAKDLGPSAPTIRKPRTLNPLGAVIYGLLLGIGHTLIYSSLLRIRYYRYYSIFGFILVAVSAAVIVVAITLTSKYILFTLKLEKEKTFPAQTIYQILLFYLGFTPAYGLSIIYLEQTIEVWEVFVNTGVVVALFALTLYANILLMKRENPSLGHLKKMMFQPLKLVLISIGIIISSIVTALLVVF